MDEFQIALPADIHFDVPSVELRRFNAEFLRVCETRKSENLLVRWDDAVLQFAHDTQLVEYQRRYVDELHFEPFRLVTGIPACFLWLRPCVVLESTDRFALLSASASRAEELKRVAREFEANHFPLSITYLDDSGEPEKSRIPSREESSKKFFIPSNRPVDSPVREAEEA